MDHVSILLLSIVVAWGCIQPEDKRPPSPAQAATDGSAGQVTVDEKQDGAQEKSEFIDVEFQVYPTNLKEGFQWDLLKERVGRYHFQINPDCDQETPRDEKAENIEANATFTLTLTRGCTYRVKAKLASFTEGEPDEALFINHKDDDEGESLVLDDSVSEQTSFSPQFQPINQDIDDEFRKEPETSQNPDQAAQDGAEESSDEQRPSRPPFGVEEVESLEIVKTETEEASPFRTRLTLTVKPLKDQNVRCTVKIATRRATNRTIFVRAGEEDTEVVLNLNSLFNPLNSDENDDKKVAEMDTCYKSGPSRAP